MPAVKVVQQPDADEVPTEVLAQAIVDIASGFKRIQAGRLKQEAIVLLLHDASRVGKPDIRAVLGSLSMLEQLYLKPKPVSAK